MTQPKTFIAEDQFLVGKGSVAARSGGPLEGASALDAISQGMDLGTTAPRPEPLKRFFGVSVVDRYLETCKASLSPDAQDLLAILIGDFEAKRVMALNWPYPSQVNVNAVPELSRSLYHVVLECVDAPSLDALEALYVRIFCAGKEQAYALTGYLAKKWKALSHDEQGVLRQETVVLTGEDKVFLSQTWTGFLCDWSTDLYPLLETEVGQTNAGGRNVARRDLVRLAIHEVSRRAVLLAQNLFFLGRCHGLLEQGISFVQWVANREDANSSCQALHGRVIPIPHLLRTGNVQNGISHALCTCDLRPVISYVITPLSQAERNPATVPFLRGDPIFDTKLLEPADVVRAVVSVGNKKNVTLQRVPVEYIEPIDRLTKRIGDLYESRYFPRTIIFAADVYELDEFQKEAQPPTGLAGSVVSWYRESVSALYVSSYATEFVPIEEALVEAWALRIWNENSVIRSSFGAQEEGSKVLIDVGEDTMQAMRRVLRPAPLLERFSLSDGQAEGFAAHLLSLSKIEFQSCLAKAGVSVDLTNKLGAVRDLQPLWRRDGTFVRFLRDAEAKRVWQMDAGRFQRSLVLLFCRPGTLQVRDPALAKKLSNVMYASVEDD